MSHVSVSSVGNAGVWVQAIVAHSEHDMVYVKDPACRSFSYDTLKLFTEIILENMPTGGPFCMTPFCLPLCMQPRKIAELFDSSISSFNEAMDEVLSIFKGREPIHESVHASMQAGNKGSST